MHFEDTDSISSQDDVHEIYVLKIHKNLNFHKQAGYNSYQMLKDG